MHVRSISKSSPVRTRDRKGVENAVGDFSVDEGGSIYMLPLRKVYLQVLVPEDEIGVPARGWADCHILGRVNHLQYCLRTPTQWPRTRTTYSFDLSHTR